MTDARRSAPPSERMAAFVSAYREMARLRYRPSAPGDGASNIAAEVERYAVDFAQEEDATQFAVGVTDLPSLRAAVWTLEALRLMCAGGSVAVDQPTLVPKLLEMAAREYERVYETKRGNDGS